MAWSSTGLSPEQREALSILAEVRRSYDDAARKAADGTYGPWADRVLAGSRASLLVTFTWTRLVCGDATPMIGL